MTGQTVPGRRIPGRWPSPGPGGGAHRRWPWPEPVTSGPHGGFHVFITPPTSACASM